MQEMPELEFDSYGWGFQHAEVRDATVEICPRCDGRKSIKAGVFPLMCPICHGEGVIASQA